MYGKIIVIEGVDGSGKNTQAKLLVEKLNSINQWTTMLSFPNYEKSFFAKDVSNYLNGEFGSIDQVPVKFAASLYAGDRFESRGVIHNNLISGKNIVMDRYTPSNVAHQCSKLKTLEEQLELQKWIENLEYGVYFLPQPDFVIFLDVPPEHAKQLVLEKEKRNYTDKAQDLHEQDSNHLKDSHSYFLKLAKENSNWNVINCFEDNKMRSINDIHNEVFQKVKHFLGDKL